ncbi:MAG TPA: phosphotransferase [Actinomycetes bacterium]
MLTFIEGDVATRPWPEWVADLDRAISVAVLLRALDDVLVGWGLPADGIVPELSPAGIPEAIGPGPTFIGHRDVTPENVVFREGRAVALIDFDMLKPSSRVDEVCNLLLWWAPLMPPEDREAVLRDEDAIARAAQLVDAYGLAPHDRARVAEVALNSADRTWFLMRARASRFAGGWQRMWDEGAGDRINRRRDWLADNRDALHTAVTSAST